MKTVFCFVAAGLLTLQACGPMIADDSTPQGAARLLLPPKPIFRTPGCVVYQFNAGAGTRTIYVVEGLSCAVAAT